MNQYPHAEDWQITHHHYAKAQIQKLTEICLLNRRQSGALRVALEHINWEEPLTTKLVEFVAELISKIYRIINGERNIWSASQENDNPESWVIEAITCHTSNDQPASDERRP